MTPTPDFFDPALLRKYNLNGPRYTSYPTALEFNTEVNNDIIDITYRRSTENA